MSVSTSPAPRKRGLGCFGIGCVILALLAVLVMAMVGGALYMGYSTVVNVTSASAASVPPLAGEKDLYPAAEQKLTDFKQKVNNHQIATLQLSADEINALIAHNPEMTNNHIHVFVTLTGNQARLQATVPTDVVSQGWLKDRYFNVDGSFEVHFDPVSKGVELIPRALKLGDKVFWGPGSDKAQTDAMRSFIPIFSQSFNNGLRADPNGAALLDHAKSIEIADGNLVIETQ